jgi:hypothetical protein
MRNPGVCLVRATRGDLVPHHDATCIPRARMMKPDASVIRIWPALRGWSWSTLVVALLLSLAGFNRAEHTAAGPDPAADQPFISRAEVRQQGAVTVCAATAEVEQLLRAWWRGSANGSIMAAVARSQLPETIPQKQTVAGFEWLHRRNAPGSRRSPLELSSRACRYPSRCCSVQASPGPRASSRRAGSHANNTRAAASTVTPQHLCRWDLASQSLWAKSRIGFPALLNALRGPA